MKVGSITEFGWILRFFSSMISFLKAKLLCEAYMSTGFESLQHPLG
jgi:hypothetical protein